MSYYVDAAEPSVSQGTVPRMPDLAVEIKSPNDTRQRLRDKAAYYLSNGTRVVWLVYPEKRMIEMLTPDDFTHVSGDGILEGGELLPGFSMTLDEVFAD